jgi:hypothetical protein
VGIDVVDDHRDRELAENLDLAIKLRRGEKRCGRPEDLVGPPQLTNRLLQLRDAIGLGRRHARRVPASISACRTQ